METHAGPIGAHSSVPQMTSYQTLVASARTLSSSFHSFYDYVAPGNCSLAEKPSGAAGALCVASLGVAEAVPWVLAHLTATFPLLGLLRPVLLKLLLLGIYAGVSSAWALLVLRRVRPGLWRFLLTLPVVVADLAAPLLLSHTDEPLLITPIAGAFSLAAFKLLAFAIDRGPLTTRRLSPAQWLGVLALPIIPAEAFAAPARTRRRPGPDGRAARLRDDGRSGASSAAGRKLLHDAALRRAPKTFRQLWADYCSNIGVALLVSWVLAVPGIPVMARHWLYTLGTATFLTAVFDAMGAWAYLLLGIHAAPAFDKPWLCDSFADFWAKRWNLVTTYMMRVLVYEPVMQGTLMPPYEDEDHAGDIDTGTAGCQPQQGGTVHGGEGDAAAAGAEEGEAEGGDGGAGNKTVSRHTERRSSPCVSRGASLGRAAVDAAAAVANAIGHAVGRHSSPAAATPDDADDPDRDLGHTHTDPDGSDPDAPTLDRQGSFRVASGADPFAPPPVPTASAAGPQPYPKVSSHQLVDDSDGEDEVMDLVSNSADTQPVDEASPAAGYDDKVAGTPSMADEALEPAGPEDERQASAGIDHGKDSATHHGSRSGAAEGSVASGRAVSSSGLRQRRSASAAVRQAGDGEEVDSAGMRTAHPTASAGGTDDNMNRIEGYGAAPGSKRPSQLRRFLALQATFAFSGAWHILVFWYNTHVFSWRWCLFFAIQAPILMVEREIKRGAKAIGLRLPHALQVVLANTLLIVVARPLFFGPADDTGFAQRNLQIGQDLLWYGLTGLERVLERLLVQQSENMLRSQ